MRLTDVYLNVLFISRLFIFRITDPFDMFQVIHHFMDPQDHHLTKWDLLATMVPLAAASKGMESLDIK